jgi:galactokinase
MTAMNAETFFGGAPEASASAPGRVNLLGEHTDHNDGYMLPVATPQRTEVAMSRSNDGHFYFYSATLDSHVTFPQDSSAPAGFGSYIEGCIRLVQARGIDVPPLRVFCQTNLAVGSGLSSSAALEVATLRALRKLLGFDLDDVALAQIAQRAEIEFAHVNCGIMDQMASSLADPDTMLFIDARTLAHRLVPLPEGTSLIVIDTGVARKLAGSKYNERRSECQEAARMLGVKALRDVTDLAAVEALPDPMRRRARHVVSDDARVLEAVAGVSAERFGELINQCHFSLRDDYEVSIPALDALAQALRDQPGVFGARMTGAGFGGACVALCRTDVAEQAAVAACAAYDKQAQDGVVGRILVPVPGERKESDD